MNKLKLLCFLCVLTGCVHKATDNAGEEIFFDEKAELRDAVPSYEFIPLETGSDNLIGKIDRVKIVDERIFILDNDITKSVQVYTIHGKFISHIGRQGNGPGEYVEPYDFWIDKSSQTIWVFDARSDRLIAYDLNTYQHLFSKKTLDRAITWMPMADGNYAWWTFMGYEKDGQLYSVVVTDSLLQNKRYFHPMDYDINGDVSMSMLYPYYRSKDNMYFYQGHLPTVYKVTAEEVKPAYQLILGRHPFPSLEYLRALQDGRDLMKTNYIVCYLLLESKTFLLTKYMVDQKMFVGIYNKKKKQTYRYADFHNEGTIFNVVSYIGTTDDDRFILSFPTEPLKRRYIEPDALRALAETVSEEDNPILCLVKFQ
jgi:hypothetical protein